VDVTEPDDLPGAPTDDTASDTDEAEDAALERARRRRRLDRIFGDVLPDGTSDERGSGPPAADRDAEIQRDVPPHHG
jgi:hypothetical protein